MCYATHAKNRGAHAKGVADSSTPRYSSMQDRQVPATSASMSYLLHQKSLLKIFHILPGSFCPFGSPSNDASRTDASTRCRKHPLKMQQASTTAHRPLPSPPAVNMRRC
eukprot:GHRQ01009399.1.p3 GENE.GHRQ01009399.1~~GHRQ01009399.1.p3  ORF type:complete len:109 (-),score=1.28 GHRQ01009399.1:799-1125(-)